MVLVSPTPEGTPRLIQGRIKSATPAVVFKLTHRRSSDKTIFRYRRFSGCIPMLIHHEQAAQPYFPSAVSGFSARLSMVVLNSLPNFFSKNIVNKGPPSAVRFPQESVTPLALNVFSGSDN